jgi:hypothetical protein
VKIVKFLRNRENEFPIVSHAPLRFAVDYGTPGKYFLSVSDYAKNIIDFVGESLPEIGDKLLAINGQHIAENRLAIEPYHRYSTTKGFWWKFAAWIPQKNYQFPLPKWSLCFELSGLLQI